MMDLLSRVYTLNWVSTIRGELHTKIHIEDIKEGEKSYSSELVENIGMEMRDVYPSVTPDVRNVLYEFVASPPRLSEAEILKLLERYGVDEEMPAQLLDLLLWWGVLGIARDGGEVSYIYSIEYNMNHLRALMRKAANGAIYHINPAVWAGLEIKA